MKSVAVITDTMSTGFFFPIWYKYYGEQFGFKNLFVLTYSGCEGDLSSFALGGRWHLEAGYKDELRARVISSWSTLLLEVYDVVIRCDVDEFLMPTSVAYKSLGDFVQRQSQPYVTARGIDVLEQPGDPRLDLTRPILGNQRLIAIRSSASNKTCLTTTPITWGAGFHSGTIFPWMGDLYLFHMKFADVAGRVEWFRHMSNLATQGSSESMYFDNGAAKLLGHQKWCAQKARLGESTVVDPDFDRAFMESIKFNPRNGIYQGEFTIAQKTFVIPEIVHAKV